MHGCIRQKHLVGFPGFVQGGIKDESSCESSGNLKIGGQALREYKIASKRYFLIRKRNSSFLGG